MKSHLKWAWISRKHLKFEGIIVQDDPASEVYPIATNWTWWKQEELGRDFSVENENLAVADNIRSKQDQMLYK